MNVLVVAFVTIICPIAAFAQFDKSYIPEPITDTIPASTLYALKTKLQLDKSKVSESSKEVTAFVKEIYDKRTTNVIGQFNSDRFIVGGELTPLLQRILTNIYTANSQLAREASVYAFRSEAANAISFGDGTIAFTLGLLSRMESESQIAFVLCHELAHYHNKHSDKKTTEIAQINFDPELKKKVRQIKRSEYNQFSRYTALFQSLDVSITRHSRDKEAEADSVGLTFYLNTKYDLSAPVRTLQILDSVDVNKRVQNLPLKTTFAFNEYPFKDSWLSYTPSNKWHIDQDADSLHTHPSCEQRIISLQKQLQHAKPAGINNEPLSQPALMSVRTRSEFEIAISHYHFRNYGRGLFLFLQLSNEYPNNGYLHAMVAEGLYELYWNQKNHLLTSVVALPDSRFAENYDRFLTFVYKLRLMELASLSYYYTSTKKILYDNQEDFLYACWLTSKTEVSQMQPLSIRAEYIAKFPKGKHLPYMK